MSSVEANGNGAKPSLMGPTDPVIRVTDLHKYYELGEARVHALRGASIEIRAGEFVAIMGASGSGKSTFMNILGCLDKPSSGTYALEGVDVSRHDKKALALIRNQKIGFVFQAYNLLARTSALENVELPLLYNPTISAKERKDRAVRSLQAVNLGDRLDHLPNQLSGGQQQLVAVARAVIGKPKLILADEPTGSLHSSQGKMIMDLLKRLNDDGTTIIQVTHNDAWAAYGNRIIQLADGWIVDGEKTASTAVKVG